MRGISKLVSQYMYNKSMMIKEDQGIDLII